MSQIMLQIPVQASTATNATIVPTTTFAEPAAGNVAVYANYDETTPALLAKYPTLKNEHVTGWKAIYRGWKAFAYAPFGITIGSNVYGWVPISAPYPEYRKWAADFTLVTDDVTAGVSLFCIGIDEAFAGGEGLDTLLVKNAFTKLQNYYLENY